MNTMNTGTTIGGTNQVFIAGSPGKDIVWKAVTSAPPAAAAPAQSRRDAAENLPRAAFRQESRPHFIAQSLASAGPVILVPVSVPNAGSGRIDTNQAFRTESVGLQPDGGGGRGLRRINQARFADQNYVRLTLLLRFYMVFPVLDCKGNNIV
jgi:hypothetical protein